VKHQREKRKLWTLGIIHDASYILQRSSNKIPLRCSSSFYLLVFMAPHANCYCFHIRIPSMWPNINMYTDVSLMKSLILLVPYSFQIMGWWKLNNDIRVTYLEKENEAEILIFPERKQKHKWTVHHLVVHHTVHRNASTDVAMKIILVLAHIAVAISKLEYQHNTCNSSISSLCFFLSNLPEIIKMSQPCKIIFLGCCFMSDNLRKLLRFICHDIVFAQWARVSVSYFGYPTVLLLILTKKNCCKRWQNTLFLMLSRWYRWWDCKCCYK